MPKTSNPWQTVSIHPLIGVLDTRSRPTDIPPGGFRWKQNFQVTPDAKLCRRAGFTRAFSDASPYTNFDLHHQGQTREPITFLFESTSNDGTRRLYVGTQSSVWLLDADTGNYTPVITGLGDTGTRWRAAELQNSIVFTNNHDKVRMFDPATPGVVTEVGSLSGLGITRAAVIIQWNGFLFVMNTDYGGQNTPSRIWWSDLNIADSFTATTSGLAGFQDLDYGDAILAAAPLLGGLYVFTRRAIWKITVSPDTTDGASPFAFQKVYTEPKNQSGCLAFPNTLVSTGLDLYYMGRDGIYRYNPYIPTPERDDWLHRADGLMYRKLDTSIDDEFCMSPVAEYSPSTREIWFSWPSVGQDGVNNWSLIAQIEQKTADVVDHGFTSFCNFRLTPVTPEQCNESQYFLGASGYDWAIKNIGGAFYREFVVTDEGGDLTADVADSGTYYTRGYYSILRGAIPLGLNDRDKIVRSILIDHDTSEEATPCAVQLRIGNAFSMVDPNSLVDVSKPSAPANCDPTCAPLWALIRDVATGKDYKLLQCPDKKTNPSLRAAGQRVGDGMEWNTRQQGRFLHFEIVIANQNGTAAIGGDSCFQRIDFDSMALPKP